MPVWIFCTQEGTPYDLAFVQRVFKRVVTEAKLPPHFTPHCLRHSYASQLLQLGVSPVYVQRQLLWVAGQHLVLVQAIGDQRESGAPIADVDERP